MLLTDSEQKEYRRRGFVVKNCVFSERECASFREGAQRAEARLLGRILDAAAESAATEYRLDGNRFVDLDDVTVQFEHASVNDRLRVVEPVNEVEPVFDRLLDDPRLCEPMRQIVPCDQLALWTAKLNFKHPRVGSGFGWHQDAPYWIHDSDHVEKLPNAMVLFDDANADNGCLRVIDGSHLAGCLPGCEDGRQLQGFYTHPDCVDESAQVLIEAPAGSAIFFDPYIVHGSGANLSDSPRRAIIITYQPAGFTALKSGRVREIR